MLWETQPNCYKVLGIPRGVEMPATRRAVRGLALLYHPDKSSRPEHIFVVNQALHRLYRPH